MSLLDRLLYTDEELATKRRNQERKEANELKREKDAIQQQIKECDDQIEECNATIKNHADPSSEHVRTAYKLSEKYTKAKNNLLLVQLRYVEMGTMMNSIKHGAVLQSRMKTFEESLRSNNKLLSAKKARKLAKSIHGQWEASNIISKEISKAFDSVFDEPNSGPNLLANASSSSSSSSHHHPEYKDDLLKTFARSSSSAPPPEKDVIEARRVELILQDLDDLPLPLDSITQGATKSPLSESDLK